MTAATELQLHNVNLTYRALPALRGINWSLQAGQVPDSLP